MKITILIDNPHSWMMQYVSDLIANLEREHHIVTLSNNLSDVSSGDVLFLLSCEKLVPSSTRERFSHTIVIHASNLPEGKGWSPTTWQILEEKDTIPLTLFEATDAIDSGDVYLRDTLRLNGTELSNEWQAKLGKKINEMASMFVKRFGTLTPQKQTGKESFYRKRTPKDSELDVNKTIAQQFNLLRVVDNEHYPAYVMYKGRKYILKIFAE